MVEAGVQGWCSRPDVHGLTLIKVPAHRNGTLAVMTKNSIAVALAAGLTALMPAVDRARAQTDAKREVWKVTLGQQLRDERKCELKAFLAVRRFRLAGDDVLEGRISCYDGREFDFTRPQPHSKFTIRLCLPTAC